MGQRSREIGLALGMSPSNVRMIWRKPEAKEYLMRYIEMVDIISGIALGRLRLEAVQVLRDLLQQRKNPRLALDAAKDVLDRTGLKNEVP